jgi:glycosyltransferase involved in cell wall biosynthesis
MRILIAHNRYKYAGGEDTAMRAEMQMLRAAGHQVELLEADNRSIDGIVSKIAAAGSLFRSPDTERRMNSLLREFRPHIVHVHNWFPLLSPSVVTAAFAAGVPVVQTLHNFRIFCANGVLHRDGKICLDCAGKRLPFGAALHACYAESRIGSAIVSAAYSYHRAARTWDSVARFIAVSEFQRDLLVRGGVRRSQLVVKPNFVTLPDQPGDGSGGYALYVGRLTPEKGIRTVMTAWSRHNIPLPLKIMGDGPLAGEVRAFAAQTPGVEYSGQRSRDEVSEAMASARFLVFASEAYETFALSIVEAFAHGTPVLAADVASIHELVRDGETGLRFTAGDADDLAAKVSSLLRPSQDCAAMRLRCRRLCETRYTDTINYGLLMKIYHQAGNAAHEAPARRRAWEAAQT